MDVQHEVLNPVSPGSVYGTTNMCVTEDSGYHTSFTPGSTECSELSLDSAILPTINTAVVSASNVLTTLDKSALKFNRKYTRLKNSRSTVTNENACLPSPVRRACKRPYQEDINTKDMIFKCSSTPTSFIAGENTKENSENRNTAKICEVAHIADEKSLNSLKDIYNIVEARQHHETPKSSPPGTPRTNRFKRFAKAGSLDSRLQLCCVRCGQPSKVNEEDSGEEWAECSSNTCAYKFCRFCKCDMHLGKKCFQYDLEAPSPSKRKKPTNIIGTKKSRKNLRRLL
ncbi:hypothetical protein EVAR_16565_1 [Eumeta japonica]|uniref:IBR domain-containing protein n=1 Tax=Eumeta variegata TaxID=151549 RepID=A0A4C1U2Z7_EUMVA|nr:hypothetical protein EVAR_16565_1 [Eumeta japonica]